MANRDQYWSERSRRDQQGRWRRESERPESGYGRRGEDRSFGGEGGEPWRGEARYGARYDQDRTGYGGQEYGMEGGRSHEMDAGRRDYGGPGRRETWRPDRGEPYGDLELNPRNRGVEEYGPPSDYAYHPQAGAEFDPDYLHWREEQMRGHDRDYHEWRKNQRQAYDEDYRQFRAERREHFGKTFRDWRNQRNAAGGVADTGVAPGASGYGSKVGMPSGYDASASSKPSGMIEPLTAMNASPGAAQVAQDTPGGGGQSGPRDTSPEFGKEPPQVQAAAGGRERDDQEEKRDERR